jgi:hypothetical protein
MPHRAVIRTIGWLILMAWRKLRRVIIYRVLHVDDTPHRIALSLALAIFVTWTPTIGFQMILAFALAALLGANKFVGVPFVWISNPFTFVPIYLPNYLLGSVLLGGHYSSSRFLDAVSRASQFQGGWWARVQAWWEAIWPIFLPLTLGSLIIGTILGTITYFVSFYGIRAYRKRREEFLAHVRQRRARKRASRLGRWMHRRHEESPKTNHGDRTDSSPPDQAD